MQQLLDHRFLVRLRQDRSIREALFVFLLTRSFIFLILICVGHANVVVYKEVSDAIISFDHGSIARNLRQTMGQADAAHYLDLSRDGYLKAPFDINNERCKKYAFFPMLPIVLWLLSHVVNDVILWGAALCNLFFFFALVLLYKLTIALGYDDSTARRTIFYLAAFPASYFFSMPFTEPLFVFLTVASFYAARRERWWVAGLTGMLASATRLTGIFLFSALLILSWQMYRSLPVRKVLGVLLIPLGLFAYMVFSWWNTGDALAFKHASEAWQRKPSFFFLGALIRYLIHPHTVAEAWNIHLLNAAAALLCFVAIYVLARRRQWAFALYTFLSVLMPLSSGILQSLERYTMGYFPMFLALGIAVNSEKLDQTIRFIFVFLLGLATLLFAARFSNALS